MQRKKLLVILGAGSSIPLGFPSVADLDAEMLAWSGSCSFTEPTIYSSTGASNYYEFVKTMMLHYQATAGAGDRISAPPINFESILGQMVSLSTWVTPAPWGNSLRQMTGSDLGGLRFNRSGGTAFAETVSVNTQLVTLLIMLAQYMRDKSRALSITNPSFISYRELLTVLKSEFELGVYNLNYDNAAVEALPDNYCGFSSSGEFDPQEVHSRTSWDFVYHLHGSIFHHFIDPLDYKIVWQPNLRATFLDGHRGSSTIAVSNQNTLPKTTLIAGGYKLDQLLQEPFHSLYSSLVRDAWKADAILVGGYGFGDLHVNSALLSRLNSGTERPRVVVLDYSDDRGDNLEFRNDRWKHEFCRSLRVEAAGFKVPGNSAPWSIREIKTAETFEVNGTRSTAVWYGGFPEAVTRKNEIAQWLGGAPDSVLGP